MELYRVLLVDDEEDIREGISRKMDWLGLGFSLVGEAANGQDALELAETLRPDVILTDIKMPFMDGLELCRILTDRLPASRFVVFSGFDAFEYAKQAIQMNVVEYILKPINADELSAVLRRLKEELDRERAERRNMELLRSRYTENLPILRELFYTNLLDGRIEPGTERERAARLDIDLQGEEWAVGLAYIGSDRRDALSTLSVQKLLEESLTADRCRLTLYNDWVAVIVSLTESFTIYDLIRILDSKTTEDLAAFSDVWVNRKGMPTLTFRTDGQELEIRQHDPYNRGLLWPQRFAVTLCGERDSVIRVNMTDTLFRMQLPFVPSRVLPNTDGRGYGVFVPDEPALHWLAAHWWEIEDDTARQSLLMVLYENYLAKHISADDWVNSLITGLPAEKNALVASTASGYLANVMREIAPANRAEVEARIYTMTQNHPLPSCRIQLMRLFMQNAISEPMVKKLYILWQQQSDKHLNRQDYTTLAYELAIRMPLESEQILRTQRARIDDPDRLRQFDFISRAAVSDTARLDTLFNSLLAAENRRIEPWTTAVIRYLNHPLREDQSVKYIRPGLEVLEEVQCTGDIFFPKNWAAALLGNHLSSSAYEEVVRFLNERPDYSPLLKNKILQAAYPLYRANN